MAEVSSQVCTPRQASGADSRDFRSREDNVDPEAHELQEIQTREDYELENLTPSASSGDEYHIVTRRTTSQALAAQAEARRRRRARQGVWGKFTRFWTHNVTLTVPLKSNRDYLALERTFLAYIRTSVVVTQQGVLIAQLFRLQGLKSWTDHLGFQRVGMPLSISCYCVGIFVAFIGAYRFWKQQHAIARGKIYAGGVELQSVGILLGCITLVLFVVSIAIAVERRPNSSVLVE
ncbi:hypothetical protein N7457_006378 [Penicillium paradoxum]|uniref:uncharacterized protein n=1 Tax=Penicillium paradoxum TaxID=176176 RepID=UPI0025496EC0|nr:uncharacterized protein N7457_006378 [Penicillium paradoxum]KAJ5781218.1 hypothetical protein N7457_006378 [Penicillium paradoxum]